MNQSVPVFNNQFELLKQPSSEKLSFWKFFLRYPIFLLAFGPPIFRPGSGIDATRGEIDFWALFQIIWIGAIAARAIFRLASAHLILIPRRVRSVFRSAFLLGLFFLASAEYSPSRFVSAAYAVIYFLTTICAVEFVVDIQKNSFDWMQCLFHLRMVFFLLMCLVIITIFIDPNIVMAWLPGVGIRLLGGTVAPVGVICPFMAVISIYSFLFSLESKARSAFFFMAGLAGTLITQSRGCELAFLASLALIGFFWSGTSRRNNYLFIASSFASVLLGSAVLAVGGGDRIWNIFNRGQSIEGIESVSGRANIWKFVIDYCMAHPFGMGYIAGFRTVFREYNTLSQVFTAAHIGNTHSSFIDVLADAGWLAFAVYLFLLVKIVALGWRYARKRAILLTASEQRTRHALRCALALLVFCLVCGIDSSDFCIPLRGSFYLQNIVFAIILGISARMLIASRAQPITPPA
jgi:hypothetical protein